MKLRKLEIILQGFENFPAPDAALEQYVTPPEVAARLLFHAYMKRDLMDKSALDLGCGTGIIACGAALLDAAKVTGVDIDPGAIAAARRNAEKSGVEVEFVISDITDFECRHFDTAVMNPPFGAQKKHADRPFIDKALECADVIYGIFNEGSIPFIRSYISGRGEIDETVSCSFPIKKTFAHHKKECLEIRVEIIRITKI
ncbi:MAG: methyltransferase [Methanomicrobiaceae archaeon]|nr:methyltransferase [Methanomicrobiaceae archaeon]